MAKTIEPWRFFLQKRLDAEAKRLHANAQEFSKQTRLWQTLVGDLNDKLKQLGEAESWWENVIWNTRLVGLSFACSYLQSQIREAWTNYVFWR